jgi:hypothetical protein
LQHKQGAQITVSLARFSEEPHNDDPAAYVEYKTGTYGDDVERKKIVLGGQPALLVRNHYPDNGLAETVLTVRGGKGISVAYESASESTAHRAAWEAFLASFKFR